MTNDKLSAFFRPGLFAQSDSLAVLHLRRDLLVPTVLRAQDDANEGYDEGKVTNTRFGSFPHSTLIDVPWGSQVRASAVDTGSRGRRGINGKDANGHKRKRDVEMPEGSMPDELDRPVTAATKAAVAASTGFVHILPPTAENWTSSLPHRTQVVYTPDYSYILHRLRARPGTVLIEAGAGSGSFTHAAARAVYNGYPQSSLDGAGESQSSNPSHGKVWSFEFHEQRVEKLKAEVKEHGLDDIVYVTYRDVCEDGFRPNDEQYSISSIDANAVFLDLPAPWLAIRHLIRKAAIKSSKSSSDTNYIDHATSKGGEIDLSSATVANGDNDMSNNTGSRYSPLSSDSAIQICTFSPCIEQAQRTVTTLRQMGWVDIEMVETAAKRIEIKRERVGLQEEGLRGVIASPASVEEAIGKLREVEARTKVFHADDAEKSRPLGKPSIPNRKPPSLYGSKQQRLANIREAVEERKLYKEGRLIHRGESELKTHTSYLVFAILPREWTADDEERARKAWPSKVTTKSLDQENVSRRQMKRNAKAKAGANKAFELSRQEAIP